MVFLFITNFLFCAILFAYFYKSQNKLFDFLNKKDRVECFYVVDSLLKAAASQNIISYTLFGRLRFYVDYLDILELIDLKEISEKLIEYSTKLAKNEIDDELLQIRIWCENKRIDLDKLLRGGGK